MPKRQKDLSGNSVNEAVFKKGAYLIEEKINPTRVTKLFGLADNYKWLAQQHYKVKKTI